jgi:predicted nucleotidyltransferase
MTEFGLSADDLRKIRTVLRSYPEIKEILIYGSRAKGTHRLGSDIDLTIRKSTIDFQTLNRISADLDALHLPYTFDLSIFENIQSSELIEHINRVGKCFF